ncbi:MAG: hypothetical protein A3F13_02330 [Gammaproteobacteria bacterium RIFCSPHIGHO2_12_FULL_40_19]|nr:MAG: hypothetical protein A3F13_02330 [Gammaproteobacteria bacterium RIFCSPHIGHO2_12_FULL_40_19]
MMDEKKNTSPDDEYQFPQDEYIATDSEHHTDFGADPSLNPEMASSATGGDKSARGGKWFDHLKKLKDIKNKRVVIVIVVLVILIVGYRLFSGGEKVTTLPPVVTQSTAPAPVVAPTPVVSTQPSGDGEMLNSLDSLRVHSSETATQIKTLQGQMADMQNMLQQSQLANQQLQKTVAALTGQLNAISAEMNQVIANAHSRGKGKRIVFHLRAVVPDRAWITANTGETMSVTLGDRIDQYGTVSAIDPARGIIETSSGRKIEYGQNDY